LVRILLAGERRRSDPGADLDSLHGVDGHERAGEVAVELVVDRLAQAYGHTRRHHLDHCARGRAALAHIIEITLPGLRRLPVGAPEGIVLDRIPVPACAVDLVRADLDHGAADSDALTQDFAGDCAGGDAACGFARRRATAPAVIADAVLGPIGVVGVARAEFVLGVVVILRARVDVLDHQRDRRTRRLPLEDA